MSARQFQISSKKTNWGIVQVRKDTASVLSIREAFQAVRLHNTDVVVKDGHHLVLNSGGWATDVTKRVINRTLEQLGVPYYIAQRDFTWYVFSALTHEKLAEFEDGYRVLMRGES